ncbi:trace amine-associated receptor 3-like [Ostrea edulis]|uniref:trace amine-associated receptor 3-like n=1 Tax=Ostrea edulis TaxID=37623 RepID=UPI00209648CE|nr:trace amine-associated receptor 3-like [Ostrea edulis]
MAENSTYAEHCYAWLREDLSDTVTLDEANARFQARHVGGIVFVTLLSAIGVIGNLHVLVMFLRHYKRSSYRTYILCLGVLDMINSTISMPLTVFYLSHPLNYFNDFFCKIYRFLLYYISIASTFILVIIAVDRYRKINTPLKRQWTEKQTFRICMAGLVFGLVFAWPAPVLYGGSSVNLPVNNLTGHRCYIEDKFKHTSYTAVFNIVLTSLFFLIFTILITLYHFIWRAVKSHVDFSLQHQTGSLSSLANSMSVGLDKLKNSTKDADKTVRNHKYLQLRRTTITLLSVTIGYLLSAFPHHCLALVIFVFPDVECTMSFGASVVFYTFVWIFLVNNVINPIIYSFSDVRFLKQLKLSYGCGNSDDIESI